MKKSPKRVFFAVFFAVFSVRFPGNKCTTGKDCSELRRSLCDVEPCSTHSLLMLSVAGMSPPSAMAIAVNTAIQSDDCRQFYRLCLPTYGCQEDLCAEYRPIKFGGMRPSSVGCCAWHVTRRRSPTPWSVERLGWRCAWGAASTRRCPMCAVVSPTACLQPVGSDIRGRGGGGMQACPLLLTDNHESHDE